MQPLISSACFTIACLLIFISLKWFDKRLLLVFGLLFAVYIGADDVMTSLPSLTSIANYLPGKWNWEGKIFSLMLSMGLIYALKMDRQAMGLALTQKNIGKSVIALTILTLFSFSLGFIFKPGIPNIETMAFQATMPGLAEELAYRGVAPALLLGLIRLKPNRDGIPWTVILITALSFGVWHGLNYSHSGLSFDLMSAIFPLIGGVAYGWLRFSSGSLLFPVLAHSMGNCVFYVFSFM